MNGSEAELNGIMVRQARLHVAVADHTKFGVVANWQICEAKAIKTLITDSGAANEMIAPFQKPGIEVIRV